MLIQVVLQDITDTLGDETLSKAAMEMDAIKAKSFRMAIQVHIELIR